MVDELRDIKLPGAVKGNDGISYAWVQLTQAAYDALTQAEKDDISINYHITDI